MPTRDLRGKMKAAPEPLPPIEKKLICWSLGPSLAGLERCVAVNRLFPLN